MEYRGGSLFAEESDNHREDHQDSHPEPDDHPGAGPGPLRLGRWGLAERATGVGSRSEGTFTLVVAHDSSLRNGYRCIGNDQPSIGVTIPMRDTRPGAGYTGAGYPGASSAGPTDQAIPSRMSCSLATTASAPTRSRITRRISAPAPITS